MLTYALYARSLCLFRRLRKHEKFLVRHALHGFKLSHCAWLTAHKFAGPKEDKLEREAGSEGEDEEVTKMITVSYHHSQKSRV